MTLIVGALVAFVGVGVLARHAVTRVFAIIIVSTNVISQLGFVGNSAYPLWALTSIALTGVAIYALIVRWDEGQPAT